MVKIFDLLLSAMASMYGFAVQTRLTAYDWQVMKTRRLPGLVVSVGNLTVGGTGKTPMTMFLARQFLDLGYKPVILSRGYKSQSGHAPAVVDTSFRGDWKRYGDEPFLMARKLPNVPVTVARDRYAGGLYALQRFGGEGQIFILDDGYQHISLHRDINMLLINAGNPFGNGGLLPKGTLREPLEQMRRANLIIITKISHAAPEKLLEIEETCKLHNPEAPIFKCRFLAHHLISIDDPGKIPLNSIRGEKILTFSGVADPVFFKQLLQDDGVTVSDHLTFPDHHDYKEKDFQRIRQRAKDLGVKFIVTTEKDFVKLRSSDVLLILKEYPIWALALRVELLESPGKWKEFWENYGINGLT